MAHPFRPHRWFAAVYARLAAHEGRSARHARREVVGGARGRVLEIGFGVGTNWRYLPGDAHYVGIEPDRYMLRYARRAVAGEGRPLALVQAAAEALPFRDASFDTVVSTLTFCTVGDPDRGLAEVRRVLRPGGVFRAWEHVRPRGLRGRLAELVTPAWRALGAGCEPNRNTVAALRRAGFRVEGRRGRFGLLDMVIVEAVADDGPGAGHPPILGGREPA